MHIITIGNISIIIFTTSSPIAVESSHEHYTQLPANKLHTYVVMYTTSVFFPENLLFQSHDPTQPTKNKNSRPITNPSQPMGQLINPWTTLCCTIFNFTSLSVYDMT